eukprot:148353-Chlamydomonas_euryale.AAC.1
MTRTWCLLPTTPQSCAPPRRSCARRRRGKRCGGAFWGGGAGRHGREQASHRVDRAGWPGGDGGKGKEQGGLTDRVQGGAGVGSMCAWECGGARMGASALAPTRPVSPLLTPGHPPTLCFSL